MASVQVDCGAFKKNNDGHGLRPRTRPFTRA
jgi:hypothetical protein